MAKNLILGFLFLFISSSCQRTNDYYTDINDSSVEHVKITEIKGLELSFSAIKINEKLIIIQYIKLLDRTTNLENISLFINGVEKPALENKEYYKESGERFSYYKFEEIRNYVNGQINTNTTVNNYYVDPRIKDLDDLNFKVLIKSNAQTISKQITMKRHSRYRFFLEGA